MVRDIGAGTQPGNTISLARLRAGCHGARCLFVFNDAIPHNFRLFSLSPVRLAGNLELGMALLAFGINHKTASVDLRERAAFTPEALVPALRAASQAAGLQELAILSTCNRTEFYGAAEQSATQVRQRMLEWIARERGLAAEQLDPVWYCHEGGEAVRHAMRVAAGLDSMILGEPQIFGQMKSAYHVAAEAGTLGHHLEQLFQETFAAAKQVRSETAIGASPVSIGYAAVNLARQVFESLARTPVLLIGAGEMNTLVARHLREQGVSDLVVINRTLSRAQALADEVGAAVLPWSALPEALARADMVVSCTASAMPVVSAAMVRHAMASRRHRPLLLIDIAVPRDIEPAVAALDDVFLYSVDDLQTVVDASWRQRQVAAEAAEQLVDQRVARFDAGRRVQQEAGELIRRFRAQALALADAEQAQALARLRRGVPVEDVLARFQHNLLNKWLHAPTVSLRELAAADDAEALQALARQLGVDTGAEDASRRSSRRTRS